MSRTTEYLIERLKDPSLSKDERKALERALATHGPSYQGFAPGQKIIAWGNTNGEVCTWDVFFKQFSTYDKERVEREHWVPYKENLTGNINASPVNEVTLA